MKIFFKDFNFSTKEKTELLDITNFIANFVFECRVNSGICIIYSPHSTTALIVNEHEKGLIKDIISKISEEFPRDKDWLHNQIDNNASSHIASAFLDSSRIFPIRNDHLARGTWQNIFLLELDGPRKRNVVCEVIGE